MVIGGGVVVVGGGGVGVVIVVVVVAVVIVVAINDRSTDDSLNIRNDLSIPCRQTRERKDVLKYGKRRVKGVLNGALKGVLKGEKRCIKSIVKVC